MDRIARHGDSPEQVWEKSTNLVRLAAQAYEKSDADYRSPFWDLLGRGSAPAEEEMFVAAREAALRLNHAVLSKGEAETLSVLCGPSFPGYPGNRVMIEQGAESLAATASLDAILVLAVMTWSGISRLQLLDADVYLRCLQSCCAAYDEKIDAGPFGGMIHGLVLHRFVRQLWDPVHPSRWPYVSLIRPRNREGTDDPTLHYFLNIETGPFSSKAVNKQQAAAVLPIDERVLWLSRAPLFREYFRVKRDPWLLHDYPLLRTAGALWPHDKKWISLFGPNFLVCGPTEYQSERTPPKRGLKSKNDQRRARRRATG